MGLVEVVNKKPMATYFNLLTVGETFRHSDSGELYLKVSKNDAFLFSKNALYTLGSETRVIPIDCKLVVEGNN